MKSVRRISLSLVLGLCLALVGSASAAPITLGPPLATTTFIGGACKGGCTVAQLSVGGGGLITSPVDGLITSWSIKNANSTPGYAIRTLTLSDANFTGAGTSAPQTPAGAGVESFPTALPVKKGQSVGVNVPAGGSLGYLEGGIYAYFSPILGDGATGPPIQGSGVLSFNAQIQPQPTITGISPPSGPISGPTAVTILGTDFEGVSSVKFGAAPATAFAVNSETQITAFAPPAAPGGVSVAVTTIAGTATAAQAFIYEPPSAPPAPSPPVPRTCKVPKLKSKTLKASKKQIRAAECSVGNLTKRNGVTAKTGDVVKQVPPPGTVVPIGTKVAVTLG